jgi:transcriptional regulator of acetoin/glycerol metabolism
MPPNHGAVAVAASPWTTPSALPVAGHPAHAELIEQSHLRCAALGLTRVERPDFEPLMRSDLNLARERNQRLFTHAAPVMELLFEQVVNTDSMIVLTDAQGTILHSVGDDEFLQRAGKVALAPGVNWAEHSKGTNAIGTALFEESPTLVHGSEHFIHANSFLTCSAVPIFDPRGCMLGVLDVTGDQRSYHQHTMGLVRMSARMIENQWLSEDCGNRLRLHFHSRVEFIGTLLEGILVVGADGRIVGANRSALDQLGISSAALRMQSLASLFCTTAAAVFDHFRVPLPLPMRLCLPNGRQFHVSARFNGVARAMVIGGGADGEATAAAPATAVASAGDPARLSSASAGPSSGLSALQYLKTGDAQIEATVFKVQRVLNRDIPLLILGETGTGQELLARAVHLFLDEIGDMPLALQARLLRVLQERCVMPLGGQKAIPVDIAVIGATHRKLRDMIEAGSFREDLYYRLNGLVVRLPALRERSDLQAVAQRILRAECPQDPPRISPAVMALFEACTWPGNIRQLANVLRTAAVMAAGEQQIDEQHLSDDFLDDLRRAPPTTARTTARPMEAAPERAAPAITEAAAAPMPAHAPASPSASSQAPAPAITARTLGEAEIEMIRQALEAANGNISVASKRLGISRNTIYRKLRWGRTD